MDQLAENTIVTVALHPGLEQFFKQQKPHNYKKNERQTVYPIKKQEEIIAMANWLLEHKDRKYVLAFTLGINLGLRTLRKVPTWIDPPSLLGKRYPSQCK